jgi:hypothetical protein
MTPAVVGHITRSSATRATTGSRDPDLRRPLRADVGERLVIRQAGRTAAPSKVGR